MTTRPIPRFSATASRRRAVLPAAAAASAMLCVGSPPAPALAQTGLLNERSAHFLSHEGNTAFLILGVGLPLLRDQGAAGERRSLRTLDALGTSTLLTLALKYLVREKRPDNSGERNSFPSGHASAAFAVATMQAGFNPREAPLWYLGAFLIADSRVTLRRHYAHDVIAGAALGAGVGHWQQSQPRGLTLAPIIGPERQGIMVSYRNTF